MKTRMSKFVYGFAAFGIFCLACLAYAYFIEPNRLVVINSEIRIKGWDPVFDGLRIAMIGDIHGGANGGSPENIRHVVAVANAQNADIIVLLGDYVSENKNGGLKMPMREIADNMAGLAAKDGVFAVLGNHDGRYSDNDVAAELTRVGYKVLQNDVVVIERGEKHLRILGLRDQLHVGVWKEFSDDAKRSVAPTDNTGNLIALEHAPDILPLLTGDLSISPDLKLILSAHTHGGQVWLPIFGRPIIPSSYGQKYAYGHIFDRGMGMFVTSGTGTSILPFRFMVPPEIAVVTVRAE